jgi:hypothetical protein
MDRIENDASNNSSIVAAAGSFLPSRCLATIWGDSHIDTDWWEGSTKYTHVFEIG